MLIEFSVSNFRSIKEKQVLSLVAATKSGELDESNTFQVNVGRLPGLLRSVVMYGANASGKSNVIRALSTMKHLAVNSFSKLKEGQAIPVTPFLLDSEMSQRPSEFEITFIEDGTRYQYGFTATPKQFMEEWLVAYPEGKPQKWFERLFNKETNAYEWQFSRNFTGQKEIIKTSTRTNALFLSTAIQLNNEQLRPVFSWFTNKLDVIKPGTSINLQFTLDRCASEDDKRNIMSFMNAADISIVDINIEKQVWDPSLVLPGIPPDMRDKVMGELRGRMIPIIKFVHNSNGGVVSFDLKEESQGTQKLFAYAGPWLDVLAKGKVLIVDELDTSLHPLLMRHLVGLFHNSEANSKNAQLVVTTHDTTLLDSDIYRRDQIWFAEKDQSGASKLYSLLEFSPRKNEAFERGYLKGRYGALPFIGDFSS